LPLLDIMLKSFGRFSQIEGKLFLFYDERDERSIMRLTLPSRTVLIKKQEIAGLGENDYRNQMIIKLSLDQFSREPYIWVLDSDFLLTSQIRREHFFHDQRPVWVHRPWDNAAALKWKAPTENFLGLELPYQFMERPQYVLSTYMLRLFRSHIDVELIHKMEDPPSEYMAYAGFCYKFFNDQYFWSSAVDDHSGLSYSVNQRPPSYMVLDPNSSLDDAGDSRYCVFWSHWDLAEAKMREFLNAAYRRALQLELHDLENNFAPSVNVSELESDGFRSLGTQYSDGWLKSSTKFSLLVQSDSTLYLTLEVLDFPGPKVLCAITTNLAAVVYPLVAGTNKIAVTLTSHQENVIEIRLTGGIAEPHGVRVLAAKMIAIRIVES
jgi:hypothetical protein